MKQIISLALIAIAISSCISASKFSGFVQRKYEIQQRAVTYSGDYLTFNFDSLYKIPSLVASTKVTSQFIPAIFYWKWENTINCELDYSIPSRVFKSALILYADSVNLKEKLNDRKIELFVDEIPSRFVYSDKGTTVFVLVASAGQYQEAIFPVQQSLKVRYRITRQGDEPRMGVITVNTNDVIITNVWKSTKKFTWKYLDGYEKNIQFMTSQFFDRFMDEI